MRTSWITKIDNLVAHTTRLVYTVLNAVTHYTKVKSMSTTINTQEFEATHNQIAEFMQQYHFRKVMSAEDPSGVVFRDLYEMLRNLMDINDAFGNVVIAMNDFRNGGYTDLVSNLALSEVNENKLFTLNANHGRNFKFVPIVAANSVQNLLWACHEPATNGLTVRQLCNKMHEMLIDLTPVVVTMLKTNSVIYSNVVYVETIGRVYPICNFAMIELPNQQMQMVLLLQQETVDCLTTSDTLTFA